MSEKKFVEISKSFVVDSACRAGFEKLGLTCLDAVFSFSAGASLIKENLASHRSRLCFEMGSPPKTLFLKRYDAPPVVTQLRNWLSHRRRASLGVLEFEQANNLSAAGISTVKSVACGEQWGVLFEKRSFAVTEKIPDAESLERKLPRFITMPASHKNLKLRKDFIARLGQFVKKFHDAGFRHRDLYLAHIFYANSGRFYLIDLARVFKPALFAERFRVKDIAQVYYSAPERYFSKTDRLRFYLDYAGHNGLNRRDKIFIKKVISKAKRMAGHDMRHGRGVPFAEGADLPIIPG